MNIPRFNRNPIDTSVYNRMLSRKKSKTSLIESIRKFVSDATGIDPYTDSPYQGAEFVRSRQLFMYFVRNYAGLSLYGTGRLLGKDHSTVVHAEKCVKKFTDIEPAYRDMVRSIESKIQKIKNYN